MFDYVFSTTLPTSLNSGSSTVWSRSALSPLAPDLLTPFSYSMLAEIARRGWYSYYDSLGAAPTPGARLMRQHGGRAYLNLSISAGLDAEMGIEPLALRLNGQRQPLAEWSKPGFLGGLLSRPQRKVEKALDEMVASLESVTRQAQEWFKKTTELRWSQAEILQVMEEIERVGVHSMRIFFAARHNLLLHYNYILWATQESAPFPQNLAFLQGALGAYAQLTQGELVETQMAGAVAQLAAGSVDSFAQQYGHRTMGEGEVRIPRWHEEQTVLRTAASWAAHPKAKQRPGNTADEAAIQALLAASGSAQKQVQQWLERSAQLVVLQSRALHAYAYVLAGTRRWAQAAAQEAMSDGRMTSPDDVFFFELEQVKEMMTGEWNISSVDEIRAHVAAQRGRYEAWQQIQASPLLIDDTEAAPLHPLPGSPGEASGTVFDASPSIEVREIPADASDADASDADASDADASDADANDTASIFCTTSLDSGSALLLPFATGFIGAGASPMDPVVVAACANRLPCILTSETLAAPASPGTDVVINGASGALEILDSL